MTQRWTDDLFDRQAEQLAETRAQLAENCTQLAENRTQLAETREQIEALLEGQRMIVQIYQQEHEARVEADRRFNRFIEEQQRIKARLATVIEELQQMVKFSRENGSSN